MTAAKEKTASKVALLLPSAGDARKALDKALKRLAPGGELWIVQTPGGKVPSVVSSWMIYLGFMGDRPSGDYVEVAMAEFRSRVLERLDDLKKITEDRDIRCSTVNLEGDTIKTVWKWVSKNHPEIIMVAMPEIIDPERDLFIQLAELLGKRMSVTVYRA